MRLRVCAAVALAALAACGTRSAPVTLVVRATPVPTATPAPPPPKPRPALRAAEVHIAAAPRPAAPRPVVVRTPRPVPTPVVPIGRIQIERIKLDHAIFQGDDLRTVDYGPGHRPSSAMPGQAGNAVFAGHRVTHSRPFYDIDQIQVGDRIAFVMPDGTFHYEVTEHFIVTPDDMWITYPTPHNIVTLYACHPKHSAKQRYVVRAKLLDGQGVGG